MELYYEAVTDAQNLVDLLFVCPGSEKITVSGVRRDRKWDEHFEAAPEESTEWIRVTCFENLSKQYLTHGMNLDENWIGCVEHAHFRITLKLETTKGKQCVEIGQIWMGLCATRRWCCETWGVSRNVAAVEADMWNEDSVFSANKWDAFGRVYVIMSFALSKLEDLRVTGHMADGDGHCPPISSQVWLIVEDERGYINIGKRGGKNERRSQIGHVDLTSNKWELWGEAVLFRSKERCGRFRLKALIWSDIHASISFSGQISSAHDLNASQTVYFPLNIPQLSNKTQR